MTVWIARWARRSSRGLAFLVFWTAGGLLTWDADGLWAQGDAPTELRVDIVGGTAGRLEGGVVPWSLELASPAPACVPVQADIVLVSRAEPCFSEPELCDGTESFLETNSQGIPTLFGCSDGTDNDGDGQRWRRTHG